MTKWGGFSRGARGDPRANLHLGMGDDDVINEPLPQLSALGTRALVQGGLQPPAKGLQAVGQGGGIHLWLRLRLELAQLLGQALLGVRHLLSFALELVTPDDLRQINFPQPGLLPFALGEGVTQGLPPGLQGLGQPFASMRPGECVRHAGWLAQDPAQIRPDPLVQGSGRGKPRRAALAPGRPPRIGPTAAARVVIAGGQGAPHTCQLTRATTDQAAEHVCVSGVVPAGQVGIARQAGLGRRAGLLADDGRHGDGNPLLGGGRPLTVPRPHGPPGGLAHAGGHRTGARAIGGARVHRRAENAPPRGDIPARPPAWRRDVVVGETLGPTIEGGRGLRVGIPCKDWGDHRGVDGIEPQTLGSTGALGIHDLAVGGHTPGPPLPTAPLSLPATPHPVGDQGAFILGHGPPDLEEQLIVRVLTHRALQTLDLTAPLGQCIAAEHLLHIGAGQAIRSGHQDLCQDGQGGPIPQPIHARTVEPAPTIAVVAVDVFLGQMPLRLGHPILAKPGPRLCNRLRLLLTGGRDTDIQGDFHGMPPGGVMAQNMGLRRGPSPMAEGTDRLPPTVVPRRSVRSPCGVSARGFSWVPPASREFNTQEDTLAMGLAS